MFIHELCHRNISKQFLYDVLAMLSNYAELMQLRWWLLCADLRRKELLYFINKLNNFGPIDKELKHLSYQEGSNVLNINQVFVTRHFHFQYKVEVNFFKNCSWWSIWKNKILCHTYWISRKRSTTCAFALMDFQCNKYSKWSFLLLVYLENKKCSVARPFERSRAFWVS